MFRDCLPNLYCAHLDAALGQRSAGRIRDRSGRQSHTPLRLARRRPRLRRPTRIWQGEDDNDVPAEATRWLAGRIPAPS